MPCLRMCRMAAHIRGVEASYADTYRNILSVEAAKMIVKECKPNLLLDDAPRPEWTWKWQHSYNGASDKRPDVLFLFNTSTVEAMHMCVTSAKWGL